MNQGLLQIIDANLNRTREGLRVCEDVARFALADKAIAGSLKSARHSATRAMLYSKKASLKKLALARNTEKDVLKGADFKKQKHAGVGDIFMSNIQRVKESLRVLEECCKAIDETTSRKYRKIRFNTYDIEKRSIKKIKP